MAALTKDRNTRARTSPYRVSPVAAATTIYAGCLLMRNAAGYIVPGQTATGLVGVGRAEKNVDNASGAAGEQNIEYLIGTFHFANSSGADEITFADVGKKVFAVDDQTVAKTDGSSTRSPAGIVDIVDANGVWVRMDEALTNAS